MRYKRLTLGAGEQAVAIDFHPRLTVVAGVGAIERDCLVGELLGAMSGTRRGTSVELLDDNGLGITIDRTQTEGDVATDATGRNVNANYKQADGRLDVLRSLGLDLDTVRRRCRLSATDIAASSRGDALVEQLAIADQMTLWKVAAQLQQSDAVLKTEAEFIGASVEDAPIIEQIEQRHQEFEAAQSHHESIRHHGIFVGGACAIGAIPAYLMVVWTALGFVGVAAAFTAFSIMTRRRMEHAKELEVEALSMAGAESYIGFHIRRMNELLEGQQNRERIAGAARAHREASEAWKEIAGEITLEWALTNQDKVKAAAKRRAAGTPKSVEAGPDLSTVEPAELAQTLIARVAELRKIGTGGQSLPLILDDPLRGVEASVKQWMLELIGRSAGSPQVLLFTDDPDVASWARMEAMAGHLSVIEPMGSTEEAPASAKKPTSLTVA